MRKLLGLQSHQNTPFHVSTKFWEKYPHPSPIPPYKASTSDARLHAHTPPYPTHTAKNSVDLRLHVYLGLYLQTNATQNY